MPHIESQKRVHRALDRIAQDKAPFVHMLPWIMSKDKWGKSGFLEFTQPAPENTIFIDQKAVAFTIRAAATVSTVDALGKLPQQVLDPLSPVSSQWLENTIIPRIPVVVEETQRVLYELNENPIPETFFERALIKMRRYARPGTSLDFIREATIGRVVAAADTIEIFFPRYLRLLQAVCERDLGAVPSYEFFQNLVNTSAHIVLRPASGSGKEASIYNDRLQGSQHTIHGLTAYDSDMFLLLPPTPVPDGTAQKHARKDWTVVLKKEAAMTLEAALATERDEEQKVLTHRGLGLRRRYIQQCPAKASTLEAEYTGENDNLIFVLLQRVIGQPIQAQ